MEPIEEKIKEFISSEFLDGDKSLLDSQTDLLESGIIDSIAFFRLVVFLEESFNIRVPDEQLFAENFQSLERICQFVKDRLDARKAS